jgi:hypothetical protein
MLSIEAANWRGVLGIISRRVQAKFREPGARPNDYFKNRWQGGFIEYIDIPRGSLRFYPQRSP